MMAKANCSSSDLYSCMVGVVWGAFLVGDLGFRGGLPGWGWIGLAKGLPCQAPHHPTHGYGSKCWVCLHVCSTSTVYIHLASTSTRVPNIIQYVQTFYYLVPWLSHTHPSATTFSPVLVGPHRGKSTHVLCYSISMASTLSSSSLYKFFCICQHCTMLSSATLAIKKSLPQPEEHQAMSSTIPV